MEFEYRGDLCVLHLHGRFATGQDALYLHTKAEELRGSGHIKVLVNFAGVDYVDSTGIGFLIGIYTSVKKSPVGKFALINVNRRVREVLEITRLADVLQIFSNEDAALQALSAGGKTSAQQAS